MVLHYTIPEAINIDGITQYLLMIFVLGVLLATISFIYNRIYMYKPKVLEDSGVYGEEYNDDEMDKVEEVLDNRTPLFVSEGAYKAYLRNKELNDYKNDLKYGTIKR